MGSRTQLGLCPPGRGRRELKAALRQKNARTGRAGQALQRRTSTGGLQNFPDMGGYYGVDKLMGPDVLDIYAAQEDAFLNSNGTPKNNNSSFKTFDDESDEEASSGDDDDLMDLTYLLLVDEPIRRPVEEEKKYNSFMEPLFTPIGAENLNNAGAVGNAMAANGVGKLPFNRRKLRYFDSITAQDTMTARAYLQQELQRSKKREVLLLAQHLKRTQQMQRRQLKEKLGKPLDSKDLADPETKEILPLSVSKLDGPMTPAVAAALVLESLEMNPLESIEGMSKCYEGIVAAGVALLESTVSDPTSPSNDPSGGAHTTRAEITAALTPLLITSLEQPSGDVIISLAKLRRMCGTPRYQRRFVQRIAPSLIRPPRGAMWCLKHQNDMEPILAAAELIFDCAFDIFSKGWYDRGQLLLADSKRAETLSAAAMQLKNLSSVPHENLTLDLGHSGWRSNKYKGGKDSGKGGAKEPLAEWEVIAVDRQIRVSISNIISMDWSKVVVHSREAALSTASYHRNRQSNKRTTVLLQPTTSGDMSPKNAVGSSPISPARQLTSFNATVESENSTHTALPPKDPPSDRSRSPVPTSTAPPMPLSPPPPNRSGTEDVTPNAQLFPPSDLTPPRSPTPKPKEYATDTTAASSAASSPASPQRKVSCTPPIKESISNVPDTVVSSGPPQSGGDTDRAPVSPLSVGTANPVESVPHRPMSSASSVASSVTGLTGVTGTQPSHYRTLTSTAAERKRTVAACRALRAQITRFEEAFIALHGRPPKGATERAPLATTYAQYREWKRAIRADAACRIQALFRGASTRWRLLRSNDPLAARVVMSRAGRRSVSRPPGATQSSGQPVLKELSIPTEIGDNRPDGSMMSGVMDPRYSAHGQPSSQNRSPSWGSQVVRRRPGAGSEGYGSTNSIPKPVSSPSNSVSSKVAADLANLSLPELQARKRDLKQQLKQYDMNFAKNHGRMPVKAEKEPIRHLYEKYNALKSQITLMEQEGKGTASPMATAQASPAAIAQRTVSPVGSDSEESGPRRSHPRGNRTPSSTTGQTTSQDLSVLKAEKGRLHQMLRSYEKDFYREHQRQVSSFADIRPVASQYRRYKEIKKAIAALQSGGDRRER
jgi:DNA replication and checkpoint protein